MAHASARTISKTTALFLSGALVALAGCRGPQLVTTPPMTPSFERIGAGLGDPPAVEAIRAVGRPAPAATPAPARPAAPRLAARAPAPRPAQDPVLVVRPLYRPAQALPYLQGGGAACRGGT